MQIILLKKMVHKNFLKKKIQKFEEIIIALPKASNAKNLLFLGKTYEKLINYYDEYLIPTFGVSLYYRFDIIDKDLEHQYLMNVIEEDFEENAVEVYKQNIDILKDENRK